MLTETQKEYIVLLKLSGLENKQIALKSGIPYETVKKHLERHPAFMQQGFCINCGKSFEIKKVANKTNTDTTAKLSSAVAFRQPENKKKKIDPSIQVIKVCEECGCSFTSSKYLKRKFCSKKCFQNHESAKWMLKDGN